MGQGRARTSGLRSPAPVIFLEQVGHQLGRGYAGRHRPEVLTLHQPPYLVLPEAHAEGSLHCWAPAPCRPLLPAPGICKAGGGALDPGSGGGSSPLATVASPCGRLNTGGLCGRHGRAVPSTFVQRRHHTENIGNVIAKATADRAPAGVRGCSQSVTETRLSSKFRARGNEAQRAEVPCYRAREESQDLSPGASRTPALPGPGRGYGQDSPLLHALVTAAKVGPSGAQPLLLPPLPPALGSASPTAAAVASPGHQTHGTPAHSPLPPTRAQHRSLTPGWAHLACSPARGHPMARATVRAAGARGAEHGPHFTAHLKGWWGLSLRVLPIGPERSQRTSVP